MATNGYDGLRRQLEEFNSTLGAIGVPIPPKAPIRRYLDIVRGFLDDHAASPDEAAEKWKDYDFHDWYKAMIAVDALTEAVTGVGTQPPKEFRDQVALVVAHDISQDFEPSQSKDFLYELQVATWFRKMGFDVELAEPDLRIRGGGLTGDFGLACKYPSSEKKLNQRISEGYDQIERQKIPGIVVIGMDLLVCEGTEGFELLLMSSDRDLSPIPTAGENLIIVAADMVGLHFRIFDAHGKVVVDAGAASLKAKAGAIAELEQRLTGLWPPQELTESEKRGVIVAVTSIVGYGRMKRFIEFPNDEAGAVQVVAQELGQRVERVMRQREGVPGRKPLDGALFTLHMGGHVKNPVRLQTLTQFTFQCDSESPLAGPIGIIVKQFPRLRTK